VTPAHLEQAIRANTVLISIIYGQSEVGTVQPIADLGAIAHQRGICFHTDAVQVAGRLPLNVQTLPVDLLSLSSHKLYGPQGAGALYIRPGVELVPWLAGGGQEGGLRSGTQAVPAIAGFGLAAQLAAESISTETSRLIGLRDRLLEQLSAMPSLWVTGVHGHDLQVQPLARLPHHVSVCLETQGLGGELLSGQSVVRQLNLAGIAISAGSACQSGKPVPSPVLRAMGYPDSLARGSLRFTLGRSTTAADIDWTAMVLQQILSQIQSSLTPWRVLHLV
jgi:cysteine desulfurase